MKTLKIIFSAIFILIGLFFMLPCQADSFGDFAAKALQPTFYIGKLVHSICLATGVGLMISAMIKYMEYRRYRHTRLSVIFFLLLTGLGLIGLGFLPMPVTQAVKA